MTVEKAIIKPNEPKMYENLGKILNSDKLNAIIEGEDTEAKAMVYAFIESALANLISINTTGSPNLQYARSSIESSEVSAKMLEHMGAVVHRSEVREWPEGSGCEHENIIAIFYPKDYDRSQPITDSLSFLSHADTVVADNWEKNDPHQLTKIGNKLIGRGMVDIKGPHTAVLAAAALTAPKVIESGSKPLIIGLTWGEENGLLGMEFLCQDLINKHKIELTTVINTEASDYTLMTGTKGLFVKTYNFESEKEVADSSSELHDNSMKIVVNNTGGHSSFGTPMEGADAKSLIYKTIKDLRSAGHDVEVVDIRCGTSFNTTPEFSDFTIAYSGSQESKKTITTAINAAIAQVAVEGKARADKFNELLVPLFDFKFEPVKITAEESQNLYKKTKGTNQIHKALELTTGVYETKAKLRQLPLPEGFSPNIFGYPAISVPAINGTPDKVSMTTSSRTTEVVTSKMIDEELDNVISSNNLNPSSKLDLDIPYANTDKNHPFVQSVKEVMDAVNYKDDDREWPQEKIELRKKVMGYLSSIGMPIEDITRAPYTSDANMVMKYFVNAILVHLSKGGVHSKPHGVDENMTVGELLKNAQVYAAIIFDQLLSKINKSPDNPSPNVLGYDGQQQLHMINETGIGGSPVIL